MSAKRPSSVRARAAAFAALGDETRLLLLSRLCDGERHSIRRLTQGTRLTRQAVTKHLRLLADVRMVHATREGRETLYTFNPQPGMELQAYLELVSNQWDAALSRLKAFIEN
jgi:DNA-binding transcriptional ArsR family regulator